MKFLRADSGLAMSFQVLTTVLVVGLMSVTLVATGIDDDLACELGRSVTRIADAEDSADCTDEDITPSAEPTTDSFPGTLGRTPTSFLAQPASTECTTGQNVICLTSDGTIRQCAGDQAPASSGECTASTTIDNDEVDCSAKTTTTGTRLCRVPGLGGDAGGTLVWCTGGELRTAYSRCTTKSSSNARRPTPKTADWCTRLPSKPDTAPAWACSNRGGEIYRCTTKDGSEDLTKARCTSQTFGDGELACESQRNDTTQRCTAPANNRGVTQLSCQTFVATAATGARSNIVNKPMHCTSAPALPAITAGGNPIVWSTQQVPLYRVDTRDPETIFNAGFASRDPSDRRLDAYQVDNIPSDFVGTSKDPVYALTSPVGWRYEIDTIGGIDVMETTKDPKFAHEQEIAFPGGVPIERIKAARRINPDHTLGEEVKNPHYRPLE